MRNESVRLQTILIADDGDELRGMLSVFLGANGYRVLEVADGREAVEVAVRERPDLVLMDLAMPGTDGITAVTDIREHVPASEMPILILSAYDRLEYRTEAISAGCSGYIAKPADLTALLTTINLLLRQGEDDERAHA